MKTSLSSATTGAERKYDTDIVIAGGGLSGLSAALTAAEQNVRAIVLEKLPFLGGAGLFPEGTLGIGTRFQRENGIRTTLDQVFARVMDFHHWRCNASVIRTLLEASGPTIDWLERYGVTITGVRTVFAPEKSLQVWHIIEGRGARLVKTMSDQIRKRGGVILTKTPATDLLMNADGSVAGIVAENAAGEKVTVAARAVIMATGGFASNKEMLKKYVPDVGAPGMERLLYRGPRVDGRTGDGINLALRAKAAVAGMGVLAGNSPYLDMEPAIRQFSGPDELKQARCALMQPFLWVNKHGDRFYNESLGSIFSDVYNAMTVNGGLMWSIFGESMKNSMVASGPLTPFNVTVVPGQKMAALDRGIQKGIESGFAFKEDTVEALASKIGIDPGKLRATLETINRYADQQYDPDFHRKPEHLVKFDLQRGPYYALKGLRAFFLTLGGVRINTRMQAIDEKGAVIRGLYIAGQDMGGLYDSTYDLLAEGSASSFALSSGRLAVNAIVSER